MTNHTANLHARLWDIANTLRGKMGADEFRDYILGFIFYKYLSEKMNSYADELLKPDGKLYAQVKEGTAQGDEYLKAIRGEALDKLGYFLKPSELFGEFKVPDEFQEPDLGILDFEEPEFGAPDFDADDLRENDENEKD